MASVSVKPPTVTVINHQDVSVTVILPSSAPPMLKLVNFFYLFFSGQPHPQTLLPPPQTMRKKEKDPHLRVLPLMTAEAEAEKNSRNQRKGKEQGALHLLHPAQDQDLSSPESQERKVKKKKTTEKRKNPYQINLMLICQNC